MIHGLSRTEHDSARFHHATQIGIHFKLMNCLLLKFLIFLDHSGPQITEITESKMMTRDEQLYKNSVSPKKVPIVMYKSLKP